jgi:hypothetical protein
MSAATVMLDPEYPTQKPKRPLALDVLETTNHLSGIAGLPVAVAQVGKAVGLVEKGIAAGATGLATVASSHGYNGVASVCLKIAAAAPVIATGIVCIAVVAVAFCIFRWLRSA